MLKEELVDLIRETQRLKAEQQTVEVKAASKGCPKKLYDTLSSFSNQDEGGVILFGVDESKDFDVVGVYDAQDLQKHVSEQCLQMKPKVQTLFTMAAWSFPPKFQEWTFLSVLASMREKGA